MATDVSLDHFWIPFVNSNRQKLKTLKKKKLGQNLKKKCKGYGTPRFFFQFFGRKFFFLDLIAGH